VPTPWRLPLRPRTLVNVSDAEDVLRRAVQLARGPRADAKAAVGAAHLALAVRAALCVEFADVLVLPREPAEPLVELMPRGLFDVVDLDSVELELAKVAGKLDGGQKVDVPRRGLDKAVLEAQDAVVLE